MEPLKEIFEQSFAVLLFLLGCSFLMILLHTFQSLEVAAKENIYGGDRILYEQAGQKIEEKTVTAAELLAVLGSSLDYDLLLDGIEISCKDYDVMNYNLAELITKEAYQKTYQYDAQGKLIQVIYESIPEEE